MHLRLGLGLGLELGLGLGSGLESRAFKDSASVRVRFSVRFRRIEGSA